MLEAPWHTLRVPKSLACEFLGVFSRLEYALKASRFVTAFGGDRAAPDWAKFGRSIAGTFDGVATKELAESAAYLRAHPPLRQSYSPQNGLSWLPACVSPEMSHVECLIVYVRCVRNNLFHGGKFLPQPAGYQDRDLQLVRCSLVILDSLLSADKTVEQAYFS